MRDGRLAGGDVDGAQRARHGRDRLHRGPHPQHLAGGHAALGAAGAAGDAADARRRSARSRRAPCEPRRRGELEAVADLDALDRLDAHQRAGQPGVEPAVPVHVRAEARRQAVDDAPRRRRRGCRRPCGPGRSRRPSPRCAAGSRQRTGSASRRATSSAVGHERRRAPRPPPSATTWRHDPDADGLLEEARGDRARAPPGPRSRGREARSRTGRASSKPYFCMPTRSAWPGPRPGQRRRCGPAPPSIARRRPGRPTSPAPTWATRCCRPGSRPGRPGSGRAGRRRGTSTSSCSNFIRAPRP